MDDGGPSLPLGSSAEGFRAVALTNTDGSHALLVRDGDRPRALVTIGTDARAGRVLVTPLDEGVELRKDREAAAQWIAAGSVGRPSVQQAGREPSTGEAGRDTHESSHVPAWADVIGLGLVLVIFGLTILGVLTAVAWLARLFGG